MKTLFQSKKVKIVALVLAVLFVILLVFLSLRNNQAINNADKSSDNNEMSVDDNTMESSDEPSLADVLDKESLVEDEGDEIIYLPKNEIYKFEMTDANGILLNFELQDGKWIYLDNKEIVLNQKRIDNVLNYLCDIRAVEYIEDANGEEFGLNQEAPICSIEDSTGDKILISIGNVDEDTGKVYFAINYDFSTIYVNSGKLHKVMEYGIQDLIQL